MHLSKTTLDQWRSLQAVVEFGGYAQAAEQLHRSQSTISYAVSKLEEQLGIELLRVRGRKSELTQAGKTLLLRSHLLTQQASEMEQLAEQINLGREAEINLIVDAAFPTAVLMQALKQFAPLSCGTRVQLKEVVLSGASEALQSGSADIVISGSIPTNFLGNLLLNENFIAVAHSEHPLHQLNRELNSQDLKRELQVVIRDSGSKQSIDTGWLGAEHRWTVTSIDTAKEVISAGLGFGWLPRHQIQQLLDTEQLKELPLNEGRSYQANLYLIFGKPHNIGPASRQLADLLSACSSKF